MIKSKVPCGWIVYRTSYSEILSYGGLGICDDCGTLHTEGGYLVPVLNHWMCHNCFEEWSSRAKFYPSDVEFQQHYISIYESRLPVTLEIYSWSHFLKQAGLLGS